ncbi:MAG: cupin domain-containing protein [Chloroflexi bacterium]|nr:cupin domain-containing protein [Chloroflexota bacterium]
MGTFYDDWLDDSERMENFVEEAPRVSKGKELDWVSTRQDARAALMISPETGFPTGGSLMMKAEIPVGWHTGKHVHGEEAIYVESGTGFIVIGEERFNFAPGTAIHVPFRAEHQFFNTGDVPVVYISGMAWPLEKATHMGRMIQIEDAGPNDAAAVAAAPAEESQYWKKDGRRITMHVDQYEVSSENKHGATYFLMGRNGNKNGFRATATAVSSMFVELPRSKSHSHAHPEAYLYALKGNGYSEIGGRNFVWEQGDAVHVPPGMMHHQHFNPTDEETRELRFEFGVRYWFTDQWDGFQTIDRHLRPTPLDE